MPRKFLIGMVLCNLVWGAAAAKAQNSPARDSCAHYAGIIGMQTGKLPATIGNVAIQLLASRYWTWVARQFPATFSRVDDTPLTGMVPLLHDPRMVRIMLNLYNKCRQSPSQTLGETIAKAYSIKAR